jgi:hypothetical protein
MSLRVEKDLRMAHIVASALAGNRRHIVKMLNEPVRWLPRIDTRKSSRLLNGCVAISHRTVTTGNTVLVAI